MPRPRGCSRTASSDAPTAAPAPRALEACLARRSRPVPSPLTAASRGDANGVAQGLRAPRARGVWVAPGGARGPVMAQVEGPVVRVTPASHVRECHQVAGVSPCSAVRPGAKASINKAPRRVQTPSKQNDPKMPGSCHRGVEPGGPASPQAHVRSASLSLSRRPPWPEPGAGGGRERGEGNRTSFQNATSQQAWLPSPPRVA